MQIQLDRIEEKVDKLIATIEHRLTRVETTQQGIKWLVGVVTVGAIAAIIAL